MKTNELVNFWHREQQVAHIHGWDFSHIAGRFSEETDLPWDYKATVQKYLHPNMKILDIDTGGGEFLLSLNHPHINTAATEAFPPNVQLCRDTLFPLGIEFQEADGCGTLPYPDGHFDMVINRHGNFNPIEIHRVLKDGGLFITQQVGADNDRELVELLLPNERKLPFPNQYLLHACDSFRSVGFEILEAEECFRPIRFFDVGALVWFARIIQWEFPGFSVERSLDRLLIAQDILDAKGCIEGRIHRFFLIARKIK